MNFLLESNNYLFDFMYISALFIAGGFFSMIFTSQLWKNMLITEKELKALEYIPYEDRYSLEDFNFTTDKINSNIIIENTPNGTLIMKYNEDEEGFDYWSKKSLNFKHLKAAARKYCLVFHCKNLYIDGNKSIT